MIRRACTAAGAACLLAATLAGCSGQATSTDTATATSIAPLPRLTTKTPTTAATADGDSAASSVAPLPSAARLRSTQAQDGGDGNATAASQPQGGGDQGAKEISGLPTTAADQSTADNRYLDTLKAAGINVAGVQDQLIAAGHDACANATSQMQHVALTAMAGQLIAQNRTTISADRVAAIMSTAAKASYCPRR